MKTANKQAPKKRHGVLFYTVITALILVAVAGAALAGIYHWLSPYRDYPYILPNVSYNGVDLGGLTKEDAQRAIENAMAQRSYTLTVDFPDGAQYSLTPSQQVQAQNIPEAVEQAYQYGRSSLQPAQIYRAIRAAKGSSYEVPAEYTITYDQDDLRRQVETLVSQVTVTPGNAEGTGDSAAHTVTVTPGQPGRSADADAIYAAACAAYDASSVGSISAAYTTIPVNTEQLTGVVSALYKQYHVDPVDTSATADVITHTIRLTKGTPGYTFDQQALIDAITQRAGQGDLTPYTVELQEVLPQEMDMALLIATVSTKPSLVEYHDGQLTGGTPGYTADPQEAQAAYATLNWGESASLPMEEVEPEQTLEEVQEKLFRDVLGEYHTSYTNDSNRTTNLRLACQELDGIILNAGATFSFNTFVGERTEEKGYRKAIVYVNGEEEADDGGGVCQVASTIYNAALLADLKVTDRLEHRFLVSYVPGGLDATVYWGVQDFCFQNTTDYPIRIHADVSGGQVNIVIDGTNDTGKSVRLDSKQVSSDSENVSYEAYQYVYDADGNLLEERDLGTSTYEKHK